MSCSAFIIHTFQLHGQLQSKPLPISTEMQISRGTCSIVIRLLLLSVVSCFLVACEVDTRASISEPKNPPAFKLSGSGRLGEFIVVGPFASVEDLDSFKPDVHAIWKITPLKYGVLLVDRVAPITYGVVPDGFEQDLPASGSPQPLEEGKFYTVTAPSVSAGFRRLCFKLEHSVAIKVPCEER